MRKNSQLYIFLSALITRNLSTLEAEQVVRTTRIANIATTARKRFNLSLPCIPHPHTRVDGTRGTYGIYSPTPTDRKRIEEVLAKGA